MGLLVPNQGIFTARTDNISGGTSFPFGLRGTCGATAHTKNTTWDELFSTAPWDVYAVEIMFSAVAVSAVNSACLVDIGIGAAGSEAVIIPNLNAGFADTFTNGMGQRYFFPIFIPSGTRIACTGQSAQAGGVTYDIAMFLYGKPSKPVWTGKSVTDYGTVGASSIGATITGNQSYSLSQIIASTTKAHRYLALGFGGAGSTAFPAGGQVLTGIRVGGSGAEVGIVENRPLLVTVAEVVKCMLPVGAFGDFPSGSRITAYAYKSFANAQNFDGIIYGVD